MQVYTCTPTRCSSSASRAHKGHRKNRLMATTLDTAVSKEAALRAASSVERQTASPGISVVVGDQTGITLHWRGNYMRWYRERPAPPDWECRLRNKVLGWGVLGSKRVDGMETPVCVPQHSQVVCESEDLFKLQANE
eukprot:1158017-Pelagomonas_calceolata.AAC.6